MVITNNNKIVVRIISHRRYHHYTYTYIISPDDTVEYELKKKKQKNKNEPKREDIRAGLSKRQFILIYYYYSRAEHDDGAEGSRCPSGPAGKNRELFRNARLALRHPNQTPRVCGFVISYSMNVLWYRTSSTNTRGNAHSSPWTSYAGVRGGVCVFDHLRTIFDNPLPNHLRLFVNFNI